MLVFKTKTGAELSFRNGCFYATNESEICKAIEQDLASNNPMDRAHAEELCIALERFGLIAES